MTNAKHTQGPWFVNGIAEVQTRNARQTPICIAFNHSVRAGSVSPEEAKANARLIAAAPVLLAACQTAFDSLESAALKDPYGPQAKALAQLRSAIYTAIPE